jgi:DNA-directed RNA polymerase subunit RPC12/RpoP
MGAARIQVNPGGVRVTEVCQSHPEDGEHHECLADEMRCAYCGVRIAPYPCNGCGRFLTAQQMHDAQHETGVWRCEECGG